MESYNHPIHYTIFKPNSLIQADRSELKGIEIAVYNEILNNNHKETPDVLIYRIPYNLISSDPSKNGARDRKRIGEALQKRSIYLDEKFVREYLGEKSPRSIVPFPEVVYNKDNLEIHLSPKFKKILTILELGFTKGDIETLRGFRHDVSHKFYWIARQQQTFKNTWRISVNDFRELLHITGYEDWRNFKRRVLDAISEDMEGTWMEFDLEFKRGGRGGAVKELIFKFKRGPAEEKDKPIGFEFKWEKMLQRMAVGDLMIKKLRQYVKVQSEMELPDGRKIVWDSNYIMLSAEVAKEEYEAKKNDPNRKKVQNLAAWFISGLLDGRWLDYVEVRRKEIQDTVQGALFGNPD